VPSQQLTRRAFDKQEPTMSISIRAAVLGVEQRLTMLNDIVHDPHIAEEAGAAVGYVLTMVQERPENPFCRSRRWCEIDQIAVDPGSRRRPRR
jgi:hypothetical protein